jgi:hypothetical protein
MQLLSTTVAAFFLSRGNNMILISILGFLVIREALNSMEASL